MTTEPYKQAISATRAVLAQVQADQLAEQSPCSEWNVGQVINHVIDAQRVFTAWVTGQEATTDTDWSTGDFVAAFDTESAAALAAFSADGVLQQEFDLGFAKMPGAGVMGMATTDTFTHAWDVAKATGQSTDLDAGLAQMLLAQSQQSIQDSFRNEEGNPFGLEQAAPEGAPAADQLAAFLGRAV